MKTDQTLGTWTWFWNARRFLSGKRNPGSSISLFYYTAISLQCLSQLVYSIAIIAYNMTHLIYLQWILSFTCFVFTVGYLTLPLASLSSFLLFLWHFQSYVPFLHIEYLSCSSQESNKVASGCNCHLAFFPEIIFIQFFHKANKINNNYMSHFRMCVWWIFTKEYIDGSRAVVV